MPVGINFGSVFLSFVSRLVLARLIGPTGFGAFVIWQNNVQLFGTLGTFGQQNYVLRELAHEHPRSEEARRIAFAAAKLALAASAIVGTAGVIFYLLFQRGTPGAAAFQLVGAMMFGLLVTLSSVHRGLGSIVIGVFFDRVVYQNLFILLLLFAGGMVISETTALQAYTGLLILAAVASVGYLFFEVGGGISQLLQSHGVVDQARRVLPFFIVNSLWVVNSRYLLGYCGIFLHGAVLGQIGLVFTAISIMIIPTSTVNLILVPILARRLAKPHPARVIILYLLGVSMLVLFGVLLVFLGHPFIFRVAHIVLTIPGGFVFLLCSAFGLTIIANACLIIEQLLGRAGEAARMFSVSMAAKLIGGYWIADHYGIMALVWMDVIVGLLFVATLGVRLLRSPELFNRQPDPLAGKE